MPCRHQWSSWWECVSDKLEYRVCYRCQVKQVEAVTSPPRWVRDMYKGDLDKDPPVPTTAGDEDAVGVEPTPEEGPADPRPDDKTCTICVDPEASDV